MTWIANTDARQPVSAGGLGGSDVLPDHTFLDFSGFMADSDNNYYSAPLAYRFFAGTHFTAAIKRVDDNSTGHIATELGAWQLDTDGTQLGWYSIEIRDFVPADSFWVHPDVGEAFNGASASGLAGDTAGHFRLETDGDTLWLLAHGAATVTNPYDITLHPWNPRCVTVWVWNGGGFTKIGQLDALTSNLMAGGSSGSGTDPGRFMFNDAYASPDEPGVLHVIMSEEGHLDGPSSNFADAYSFDFGSDYGILPRHYATAMQHATFDATTLTSQTTVYYDDAGTSEPADYGDIHDADSDLLQVRNEGGTPFFVRYRPNTGYSTGGYQDLIDICAIDGTVLSTIDSTFLGGSTPTSFNLSRNTIIDPFDSRRVYLLSVIGATKLIRLDVTDLTTPRYWQDDISAASGDEVLQSNSIYVSAEDVIWQVRLGLGGSRPAYVAQYDPCGDEWLSRYTSYPFSGGAYPNIEPFTDVAYWPDDETVYYIASFTSGDSIPNIYALCRTAIIPHYQLCPGSFVGLHVWQTA